jgi:adenylylsulfate kinase
MANPRLYSPTVTCPEPAPGFTLWLTGLSGAGKTTVSRLVGTELERRGVLVEVLDGDVVRTGLSEGLGYTKEDRDTNIARIGWVASRLARAGAAVVVAVISPYAEARRRAREMTEAHAPFVEVYVRASVDECARRDPKGLYMRALAGELPDFTGVSAPYEEPVAPDLEIDTEHEEPQACADRVIALLESRGLVR